MQPFAHAYFPLRPLARDANVIKEIIIKAREKLRLVSPQTPAQGTKRKRTTSESGSAHKNLEKRAGTKAKRICMTLSPARAILQQVPMDLDLEEPNPSRSSKRGGHKAFEVPGIQAHRDRNHSKRAIVTGRIRRKFRRPKQVHSTFRGASTSPWFFGWTICSSLSSLPGLVSPIKV